MSNILTVMCGLQASGKSTIAKNLSKSLNSIVVSSDEIRKEYPGYSNEKIFREVFKRINEYLKENKNVILDATNITIKMRKHIFNNIKEPCIKQCYIVNTPYNVCVERLEKRNKEKTQKEVPLEALKKYFESFEIPFYEEGWDKIIVHNIPTQEYSEKVLDSYLKMAEGFNQQNKHHTQDLGTHLKCTGDYLKNNCLNYVLIKAGYYHDIGKLFTQTIGKDKQAHYYNHANVGAYNLLCSCGMYDLYVDIKGNKLYTYRVKDVLDWLFYINYHMHLYNLTTDKSINKWKKIFGEIKYNNLMLLHEADKMSHTNV